MTTPFQRRRGRYVLAAASLAAILAGCATADGSQTAQESRSDRVYSTGSMLPHSKDRASDVKVLNPDQIDMRKTTAGGAKGG